MNFNLIPSEKINFDFAGFDDLETDWRNVPLYMNPSQISVAKTVLSLINDPDFSKPSYCASLKEEVVLDYPIVCVIDNIFTEAINNYKEELKIVTNADVAASAATRDTSLDFYKAICTGAIRFADYTPTTWGVKHLTGPILILFGGIYGSLAQNSITEEIKRDECSANRIAWFNKVLINEQIRIKKSITLIEDRVKILKRDIEEQDGDLVNLNSRRELVVLNALIGSISPGTSLTIDGHSVVEYLKLKNSGEEFTQDKLTT